MMDQQVEVMKRKTRRGRKPAPRDEARVHRVACRLTDEEVNKVDALRGKNSRGAFLRLAAFNRAPRPIPQVNIEKWAELARLHSNLNQVNKRLNEGFLLAGPQLSDLREAVPALYSVVSTLRAALVGQSADIEGGADESAC